MEGLNSVVSATKRKARGYCSTTHLVALFYFTAGQLRLPRFWFHRKQREPERVSHQAPFSNIEC